MADNYLHQHINFPDLLRIIEGETGILPGLVEKDYWIMHVLHSLKKKGFNFELKGGTSLSKGYKIIDRFSEDIDIHITPPQSLGVNENPRNTKDKSVESRKNFYDWLANEIKIDGIVSVERDTAFDDKNYYRSGGIRLFYNSKAPAVEGLKEGILLEAGFDTITPNKKLNISSWAFDKANSTITGLTDNRAIDIVCYHPGYTFVEKLQTIATKYRQEQEEKKETPNYMRQYYDVFCLLKNEEVLSFISTPEYQAHKKIRFPKADYDIPISKNEAFLLSSDGIRNSFKERYAKTANLYYRGQPDFDDVIKVIHQNLNKL